MLLHFLLKSPISGVITQLGVTLHLVSPALCRHECLNGCRNVSELIWLKSDSDEILCGEVQRDPHAQGNSIQDGREVQAVWIEPHTYYSLYHRDLLGSLYWVVFPASYTEHN